jgi:DNA (cytosine-5)-methyltransferase 1
MPDPQEDQTLVMGNRMHGVPRDADTSPSQTVCTGETLAVVGLQRHGHVTPVDEGPIGTVRAGGFHHGIVMRNNTGGGEMCTPDNEPVRTLTTSGHQSLLIPYAARNLATDAERAPAPTQTTTTRPAVVTTEGSTDG